MVHLKWKEIANFKWVTSLLQDSSWPLERQIKKIQSSWTQCHWCVSWTDSMLILKNNSQIFNIKNIFRYVPWNLHEPEEGVYDFGGGDNDFSIFLDLRKFLQLAKEEDLLVIFRPGNKKWKNKNSTFGYEIYVIFRSLHLCWMGFWGSSKVRFYTKKIFCTCLRPSFMIKLPDQSPPNFVHTSIPIQEILNTSMTPPIRPLTPGTPSFKTFSRSQEKKFCVM